MEYITISTPHINIDQLLKWAGIIDTGGQIIPMIEDNMIKLNGKAVTERRKKVYPGDIIEIDGVGKYKVIPE
ncbi:MAG: RNA-binding S4 domain-containing protein [Veillonellaceae bacterium]|jgi:ribosome-associated protein|nr:RNA-binding S4 domain-containing protein [Veillonellaceae bacterium]